MKFVVVGCGSIGRRHMTNLLSLGYQVTGVDISEEYRKWVENNISVKTYSDFLEAITKENPDACFVCTPPNSHISIAKVAVDHGIHVFIEKPLSNSIDSIDALIDAAKKKKLKIAVGYNLRFNKGIMKVKELVDNGIIGKILCARIVFGQYLPSWRPSQDYRKSYTASKQMGGGIILDDSHEIDYARWLLGEVSELSCVADRVSGLEVDTEDIAELTMKFTRGAIANIHMDFVRQDYSRNCELMGEKGTICWDYTAGEVKVYDSKSKKIEIIDVKSDPNDMYLQEIKHFIYCIQNNKDLLVDIEQGKKTLLLALKAKQSAEEGKVLKV